MIWRIHDRRTFSELRSRGSRIRRGPISVTYLSASDGTPPRVAYAIGKPVGDAVARNRLRRQLRSIVTERARAGELAPGAYVVGAQPAARSLSHAELDALVGQALAALRAA